MINKYEALFPFHKVELGASVIIYGMGDLGQEYLKQITLLQYCDVKGGVDKNYDRYTSLCIPVYPVEKIDKLCFDYIVIALKSKRNADDVRKMLLGYGVDKKKIIYTGIYEKIPNISNKPNDNVLEDVSDKVSISFNLYRGGFGDAIITKKIVERLIYLCPNVVVDIYTTGETANYLQHLYSNTYQVKIKSPLNTTIDYEDSKDNYMLAMQWNHLLRIDVYRKQVIERINLNFAQVIEKLLVEAEKYQTVTLYELIMRDKYDGKNIYTSLYYSDVLGINDMNVEIPIDFENHTISLPSKYITVDLSDEDGDKKIGKLWPRSYAVEFIEMFKKKYNDVKIIQLGAKHAKKLPNAYKMTGLDFEEVKYILKKSILHIGPEGGTVHLATQLGTKCVVLFGGTPIWYYGYPQNINISARVCIPCLSLMDNGFVCARNLKRPECMYAIKPDMVLKEVSSYIDGEGIG